MNPYSLTHLSDETLDRELVASALEECDATAVVLARIAESDARKRFASAGYPSMAAYCIATIPHLCESEAAAYNRIHAARTARDYPAIFAMVADGRLHLTSVNLLAPYLTLENADELLNAGCGLTKAAILELLAARFPRPDAPTVIQPIPDTLSGNHSFQNECSDSAPVIPPAPVPPPRIAPLSAERYDLRTTIDRETRDLLRHVQSLLGRRAANQVPEVLKDALRCFANQIERRKFGATERPHHGRRRSSRGGRYIPAEVRRAVYERDGGQCTFVSETGHRCEARTRLELDHIVPFARGGESTADNLRLRCRAHNQFEAERVYGAGFMKGKREAARATRAPEVAPAPVVPAPGAPAPQCDQHQPQERLQPAPANAPDPDRDVTPWLLSLRIGAADARRAAEYCETLGDVTLEQRVKAALSFLVPRHRRPRAA